MAICVVGRKAGMTRVFTEDGVSVPVTVIMVEPNRVTQVKDTETDGYRALQVTTGTRRASRVTKPMAIPATGSFIGMPASIIDKEAAQAEAMLEEPFDSRISETTLIV